MTPVIKKDIVRILEDNSIDWSLFRDKTILITGANGMIPSYLVWTLLCLNDKAGWNTNVIALVRNIEKAKQVFSEEYGNEHLKLQVQDVSQPIEISDKLDYIIHAASQASPKYYRVDPVGTINANVLGTINTLQLAKEKQVKGYLYFSSGEVYGQTASNIETISETDYGYIDLQSVRSCYAESKRMGEQLCIAWNQQYGIPVKIARIFHTYAPTMREDDGRVFADFCYDIANNRDIELHSDGSAVRSFCYITDAVRAYFKILLEGESGQAYNVGNTKTAVSVRKLAEILVNIYPEKHLQVIFKISKSEASKMQSPIQVNIPNTAKLEALGWNPVVSIEEGFRNVINNIIAEK